MTAQGKILAISGLLYGIVSLLIFLTPFFLYSKNKDEIKSEGVIKVVGEVLFWHVALLLVAIIIMSAINAGLSVRPEFTPAEGLKYFYGVLGGGSSNAMWEYWLSIDLDTVLNSSVPDAELVAVAIIAFKYIGLFFFLVCITIPLAVLWQTIGSITSIENANQKPYYQEYFGATQVGFLNFTIMTALIIIHCEISSMLVRIFISGFDYFKMINYAWNKLLFG